MSMYANLGTFKWVCFVWNKDEQIQILSFSQYVFIIGNLQCRKHSERPFIFTRHWWSLLTFIKMTNGSSRSYLTTLNSSVVWLKCCLQPVSILGHRSFVREEPPLFDTSIQPEWNQNGLFLFFYISNKKGLTSHQWMVPCQVQEPKTPA